MRDLVLVPTFGRPEYLALCLEYLAAADGATEKHVMISHDRHVHDAAAVTKELMEAEIVAEAYRLSGKFASLQFAVRPAHRFVGNPCNFLELYKFAFQQEDVRYIYLVEDDVIVNKDFFRWHEAVQARGDYFCTVGWHCVRNPLVKPGTDPLAYIESTRDFSSIGVCWRREKLAPFVKHATPDFYGNMGNYLGRNFPGSPIPAGQWTEQAGVVTRLLHETRDRWVAWPVSRRCSHVGVSGYHRPNGHRFAGLIGDRIEELRKAITSDRITKMSHDFTDDIEPLLPAQDWDAVQLQVVQRFPYEVGKI